ncbi:MAG: formate dehydrogenase subunit alpha [Desulfobulbaceae bacterium]|jgi:formate dehydrogenase alpha subunit|nr:formate dehydrogenase subunit alpha [Desulfobulbaceae bacterium]
MNLNLDQAMENQQFTVRINGQNISCRAGQTILEVCREAKIPVPTLCYDERLKPYGGCRLCIVEINGSEQPQASCMTYVQPGMTVTTESERLFALRKNTVQLLLHNHPNDCMVCEAGGACELQTLAYQYDAGLGKFQTKKWGLPLVEDNPFITFEPNKCVVCARCVRICHEVMMADTLTLAHNGWRTLPVTKDGQPRSSDTCEFCGQCVSACPTGALTDRRSRGKGRAMDVKKVKTTCSYCGTGCNFFLNVKDGKVVRVTSDFDAPVNKGNLCVKGRYGFDFIHSPERIKTPLIKENGVFRQASWDEALTFTARRFKEIIAKYGHDAVGGFSSSRCSNEENYLVAKMVRCAMGTNNVDNCARVCHAPTVAGLAVSLGAGAATNSLAQMADVDTIFLIGSNPTEAHPIVSLHLKKALAKGAKLIVVDPRKTWMAERADIWLGIKPGSNIALMNGIVRAILDNGWENKEFIAARTENFADMKKKIDEYDLDRVENLTGVAKEKIVEAARFYALAEKSMIVYGLGVTEHRSGAETAMSTANLALLCGQIGRPATGIMALRGQNNVQGASDLGPLPGTFPGYQPVNDEQCRKKFEAAWGVPLSGQPGLKSVEMIDHCADGKIRGLYILGEDPAHTDPDLNHVRKCLEKIEFLVVQDMFPTETTKYAHVVLPGASFAEKDGTFTNGERRVQRIRKAVEPVAGLAEWESLCRLSTLIGYEMNYRHPSEIMDEIAKLVPAYGGIRYERIEQQGIQWPCPDDNHPGTTTLHSASFARPGGKAQFIALEHIGSGETPDDEYPLILITGRVREHYNNGSMTRRCAGLSEVVPEERAEISPADAARLGIADGGWMNIASRRGALRVKAKVTERTQPGMVFMTFHHQTTLTNFLTSEHRDPITGTPEYKSCAVKIAAC